ncbi:23S rRNA (cytidine1920-2'-O)/16S rRNA (cytidine1409-2'-O)-methyltransferase [Metamycoplasma subdolum]|uniref:23S rRNA (Cytidine1920-2'-O)/16S rRNA (Cytidine1409-2'-O)-methyltransferase n=1 Tax=Metamycoplasma subdolum TaxID=92407 RepID=A0A3M0A7P8_9BACT|nr:TlyA family RNA methyltransferase [Metamycoplasma subdolum]RMA78495.1 23S rRNA (cytidine1920-2'-O)/16S rRNA (cytidine1409-2'-O)-methyltransferase [Metamycoplasma subdolum]WPB50427.1 TlyA family RNA methyltransferase [Metamycoplasma subdolum]
MKIKTKDTLLNLVVSRFEIDEKTATSFIREGKVIVNSEKLILPSLQVRLDSKIELLQKEKYVSRGAYKLLEAIKKFNINVENKICLDIGSSTGGFVQVLLEHKAKKVYANDVGTNQLDFKLRTNENVIVYEKTNLKNLDLSHFKEELDFITCDVSFISLKHVFKVAKELLKSGKQIMALIKPQFEAISKYVEEGGFVKEEHHEYIINKVINYAKENGFKLISLEPSPILGLTSKNKEYISLFEKE